MAENSTVNIISYLDTSSNTKEKSYMDNSSDFANVFESVNKTYDKKNQTIQNNDVKNTTDINPENTVEKNENTDSENKISDKDLKEENDNNSSEDNTDDNTVEKAETTIENENKKVTETANTNENVEDTSESKEQADMITVDSKETGIKIPEPIIAKPATELPEDVKELPEDVKPPVESLKNDKTTDAETENILDKSGVTKAENTNFEGMVENFVNISNTNTETVKPSTTVEKSTETKVDVMKMKNTTPIPDFITNILETGVNVVKNNINKDFTQNSNNEIPGIKQEQSAVKFQTQTQQALSNIQIEQPAMTTITMEQLPDATIQKAGDTTIIQATTETLVLDANTEAMGDNLKQKAKDTLNKTSLNQDILNATNAKVISIENSNSTNTNSNNFMTGQNAQEQAVKIQLEGISQNSQNTSPTLVTESVGQTNFVQTSNTVQVQPTKELSQTDILTQINKQLDTKNFENGETTKITIVLRPENLGKISLELINTKEGLIAQMTTENSQVKEILDKNINSLRENLSNHGVGVNNVNVKVEETQKQSNDMFSSTDNQENDLNQEFSNNTQRQNQNNNSFDKEIGNNITTENETNSEPEENTPISLHTGQVDYKV
ncbi:MAG: flagellar hook-length control protein FliK [Candidatus Gastranaerophilales bacterium]|nr:flagellar hook-length control protein FliK [Candidatus Gastranaerophilales bacterium]